MCIICETKNLDDLKGIVKLNCSDCPLITKIPNIKGLKELYCSNCPLLTEIPNIQGLVKLRCNNCPLLAEIPNINGLKELYCRGCYWLNVRNLNYASNISKLIVLQRFVKKYFKLWVCKRYIKSREFKEWFYHPDNFGGYKHKLRMYKSIKKE
jgi:uncharacterized paraquat-inducible protein A